VVRSPHRGCDLFNAPTADQVRALAPDPSAARAGEGLANIRHWPKLGRTDRLVWGLCQGSGAAPYQVVVDLGGPTFKCSCPSRKFPCKHGLGILLLHATQAAAFTAAEVPTWASEWLAARDVRAAATEERAAKSAEVDPAAQAKRAEARERKIAAGLDEFDRWLRDLMRRGLVSAKGEGYAFWDAAGARLVDAQAGSLGRAVRGFAGITNAGPAWGERALEHAARLHLVVEGYRRLETLPMPLRDDVRALVGWTVKEDEVIDDGAVADRWLALGRTVDGDERLITARTWLLGETTGRWVLHLAFAPGAAPPPIAVTGGSLSGSVAFYPSAAPLRAIIRDGATAGPPVTAVPHGVSVAEAAAAFGRLLVDDPFIESWPIVLRDVIPLGSGGRLVLRDADGAEVAVTPPGVAARLVALAGGEPLTVAGLWSGRSYQVLSASTGGRLVDMTTDSGGGPRESATSSGDPAWARLVSAALLGTERSGEDRASLGDELPFGPGFSGRDPETRLLGAAAVATVRRRAAWLPPTSDDTVPAAAQPDPRPMVGPAVGWQLRRILEDRRDLLMEWLELAVATGRRPPDEELPRLLAIAGGDAAIRTAARPLLGPRATWLVTQMPDLAAGLGNAVEDPTAAFESATEPAARADAIATLRATDPTAGRALVEGTWETAGPDERALLVRALATGLAGTDEPFLERARVDKRGEVRAAAADLLARLPGSAFSRSATETARPLLALAGRFRPSVEVALPTWDPALEQLAITRKPPQGTGERAWWLRQLLHRVDPANWESWLDADPAALIERALRADDADPVVAGWIGAARLFQDARWAAALLGAKDVLDGKVAAGSDALGLLGVLDPREREVTVIRLIKGSDAEAVARLVDACPRPWSGDLSLASLAVLARESTTDYPSQGFYDHLRIAVRRAPPSMSDELEAAVFADERRRRSGPISDAIDTLRSRQQLANAFDQERKESR